MKNFLLFVLVCAMAVNSVSAQKIGNHFFKHLDAEKIEKISELRTGNLRMQTHLALRQSASGTVKQSLDSLIISEVGKRVFSYDNRGNNTSEFLYEWNSSENNWLLSSKIEFERDNNGNLTTAVGYRRSFNEEWVLDNRVEYSYNEDGSLAMVTTSEWNPANSDWTLIDRMIYAYDENGNLIVTTTYDWSNLTNEWIERSRNVFTYGENNVLIMTTIYIWDDSEKAWMTFGRNEYSYDNDGNMTMLVFSIFFGTWLEIVKEEYIFDMSYFAADLIIPFNFDYPFINKLTEVRTSEWTEAGWRLSVTETVHWSAREIETGISTVTKDEFSFVVFPNPATLELHVKSDFPEAAHYTIFNTSGQIVMQGYLQKTSTINIAPLASGIYFLNISGQTARFVKQ